MRFYGTVLVRVDSGGLVGPIGGPWSPLKLEEDAPTTWVKVKTYVACGVPKDRCGETRIPVSFSRRVCKMGW